MRVLINGIATQGKKTGVGHYTAELIRCLRPLLGKRNFHVYSNPWYVSARNLMRQLTTPATNTAPNRPLIEEPPATVQRRGVRSWFESNLRALGMRAYQRHLTRIGNLGFTLYHEPNFLPLDIDLPTITTIHDLSVLHNPDWHPAKRIADYERGFQSGLARTKHVITVSEFVRQEVIQYLGLSPDRVSCTYNGVRPGMRPMDPTEIEAGRRALRLPSRYLLYLGTIEPRKNLMTLLKAYCSLPRSVRDDYPLVLVGGWGWNSADVATFLHDEARHRGVRYLGYLPESAMCLLYNAARALVFPSYYEGFGLPPIEMMACAGAVLASTAGAIAETVGSKANLIDPNDIDGWRNAMLGVCTDDEWWRALRTGTEKVAKPFTWERCAADTLAVYNQVVTSKRMASQAA
jgi:alpha-1,3-rhamnosyl/mannosyltransferase